MSAKVVTLFTSPSCRRCPDAKKFLNDNDMPFFEASIVDEGNRNIVVNAGFMTVPVIEVIPGFDGAERTVFDGTDRELLNRLARHVLDEDEVWA